MKTNLKAVLRSDLPSKNGLYRIDLVVYHLGKQNKVSTDKNVALKDWDKTKRRILSPSKDASLVNKYLSSQQAKFDKYMATKDAMDEEISLEEIKNLLKGKSSDKTNPEKMLITEIFDMYLSKLNTDNKRNNTIRNMKSAKTIICEFAEKKYKNSATISKINFNFIENMKAYLKTERKNSDATINKRLRNIRAVIKYANKKGYKVEDPFKDISLKSSEPKKIYLNDVEYGRFKNLELPKYVPEGMVMAKQLFIFSCETGLRYSDVMDLKWEHINGKMEMLKKRQVKTNNEVCVPLNDLPKMIIEKLGNKDSKTFVFPKITNQSLNRNLKELAELAKIEKHLTFHVARHTFASCLGKTFTNSIVMRLLGDSDPTMANVYVNMDDEDLVKKMQNFWQNLTA